MRSPALLYSLGLPTQARSFLFSSILLAFGSAPSLANDAPKSSARPVARLVSTTREELASRQRARVVSSLRAVSASASAAPRATAPPASSSERRLFDLINEERRARGRRTLVWDGELTRMARYHSENMSRQRFFNHVDRDGLDLQGRAAVHGLRGWRTLAENIAYNQGFDDPEAFAVERWMISAKHRENILNGEFTHAGLGVVRASDGTVYFTQVFMKR